jgi:hypothetical protein
LIRVTKLRARECDTDPMNTIAEYVRSVESRVVGRVFTYDQRLHFVLEADRETGLARMSCRYRDRTDIIYMPVSEVVMRLEEEIRRQTAAARPKRRR